MGTGPKADITAEWPLAPLPWQQADGQGLAAVGLPQALLVTGVEGIGKRHFAMALASQLLCRAPTDSAACGDCRCCVLLRAGSHPDLLCLVPADDSRVIKIEQVRQLLDFAAKTPAISLRKAIVLAPAEALTGNAANALLKCLEEPSASTRLLLVAHRPSALPATVRSRCQTVSLSVPPPAAAAAWLETLTGSPATSRQLLEASAGRPLLARSLFLADGLSQYLALREGVDAVLDGSLSPLELPQRVADLALDRVLELMQQRLELRLRAAVLARAGQRARDGFKLCDQLAGLRRAIVLGANPNRQLTIEDCAARMANSAAALVVAC